LEEDSVFVALGVALGAGFLIGFERQQSAESAGVPESSSMGGVRTYPLVALVGALSMLVGRAAGAWFVALAFVAVAAFVAVSYADDVRRRRDHGLTSEVAFLSAFLLGALTTSKGIFPTTREMALLVFSAAVVEASVLSLKPQMHALAGKATRDDVLASLKFLLAAVVLLPLLPDKAMGPFDALNPFRLGLMVVLIAGVGFAGYVAVRVMGAGRGLVLTGLVGGLVSSTAVTVASAARARAEPKLARTCALSVILANSVMSARVLVILAALSAALARALAVPIAALVLVGAATSAISWWRTRGVHGASVEVQHTNPFEISSAVKMALLIAAVGFATRAAAAHLGTGGVYVASVLGGTTDVDAISVSMAELTRTGSDVRVAATSVLAAMATNTAVKAGIAGVGGGVAFFRSLLVPALATLAAALAGIVWVWL
jgi:uncharacterized membrane protein (DUF4010 family)